MGTALIVIVYLTNGVSGANMSITQFDARPTQVFSSNSACQAAKAAVLAQAGTVELPFEGGRIRPGGIPPPPAPRR